MEVVLELLRGIQESLNRHEELLQNNNGKINSIKKRVKSLENHLYDYHNATSTALGYVQEDCQKILDNTADLESEAKRSSRLIKNLGRGLKLPMDYMSDTDSSFVRRGNPNYGNRRSRPIRRSPEHQVSRRSFSTPVSESDSDNDSKLSPRMVNRSLAGDHQLIPSGQKKHYQEESLDSSGREPRIIEEVPTTMAPMGDIEGDIRALQSAANISPRQPSHYPGDQPSPVNPGNFSGQTITTSSTSTLLMSPIEQATSNTVQKQFSSSLSSDSSTNQIDYQAQTRQSNIPSQTRSPLLPSGGDKSTNSMFLDNRPNIDTPSRTKSDTSRSDPTNPTTNTTQQNIQQTFQQATPTSQQATPTSQQTTPTTQQTIPAFQETTSSVSNIPLTTQETATSSQASSSVPKVTPSQTNSPPVLGASASASASASAPESDTYELGLSLKPDFSSVEKVIDSLGLPLNEDTKKAVGTAFTSDGEPSMERPKGLYTVLLVDTSYSTSHADVKRNIKSFIEDFMDEIEDSAANETLEENVALVTFGGKMTGVQQGFTNDFSLIRDAFDTLPYTGRSPLATGLAVCLTYMEKSSKQIQQNGMEIFPRVIMLTDGQATDDDDDFGNNYDTPDPSNTTVKSRIIQIVQAFHVRKYPLSCGAVNRQYSDEGMIDDIAAIGGGTKIDLFQQPNGPHQAKILGRYYFYQTIVAQVMRDLAESGGMGDASKILMDATMNKTLSLQDKDELIKMLRGHYIEAKFDNQLPVSGNSDESDDEMLKSYTFQELAHMPTIGIRVKKGPQWKQGDKDQGELGTVVAHASEGIVVVKWDKGKIDRYQYRSDFQEVMFTGGPSQPRQARSEQEVDVGCWVKRGPHWSKGDEDGQAPHGVVIRRHRNMSVTVKWPIGIVEKYKCGQDGIMEVEPVTHVPVAESEPQTNAHLPGPTNVGGAAVSSEDGLVSCWQFQDGLEQWRTLSMDESAKLDSHIANRKSGLIAVTHKGTQYRFDLRNNKYREQGGQAQGAVRQTYKTPEEYQTMMVIEDIGAM